MSSPTRESGFESMFMQKGDGLRPRSPSSSSSPPSRRSPTMEKSTDNDDGDVPAEVITVKDFFDFMKTAYQVYEHLDDGDEDDGTKINWDELTKLTVLNHVIDQQERDLLTQTAVAEPNIKYNSKSDTVLLSKSESRTSKRYSCSELEGKGRMTSLPREARVEMLGIWTEANLNCKLNDVINEGILDSILPYLIGYRKPSKTSSVYHPIIKKVSSMNDVKKPASFGTFVEEKASRDRLGRRKSLVAAIEAEHQNQKQDGDVEIHVCDEVKGMKKDFRCPQKLLVSKMGYFADVTAGQRLEDMDISVHCDIQIFDWLMRWVKRDSILVADWPLLDPHNCVPILVSASFLQMEPLLHDCLMYCHTHMSEIVKTATNLACLSDALLTRLAAMYTNVELESLKDRKDKIQSRLYCKMIMSLSEPVPESLRGHYSTLATLFKCTKCNKLLGRHVAEQVPCQPGSMRVDRRGNVVSAHSKDVTWSLNEYISWLYGELRSWRRVYWRLWADCHFLRCQLCDTYFPAYQMEWCSHHEQAAVMLCVDGRGALAAGRYPCCGERAYRFEAITRNTGCQFREHAPDEYLATDGAVLDIYNKFRDIIAMRPPQLMFPERLTKLVQRDTITDASGRLQCKEVFWWEGIQLAPPRAPLGLLGKLYTSNNKFNPRLAPAPAASVRPASATPAIALPAGTVASPEPDKKPLKEKESKQKKGVPAGGDSPEDCGEQTSSDSERSSASARSDEDKPPRRRVQRQARVASSPSCKRGRAAGRQWAACASARSNQDQQRRFEERAARQMRQALAKRAHLLPPAKPRAPTGGAYARLEAEWRERHATRARSAAPPAGAGAAARQRMLPSHKYKS